MSNTDPSAASVPVENDDARAERDRVRHEILESMFHLNIEGNLQPSADEIAKRANLESGAVFAYFDSIDDLYQAAITRQRNRMLPLVAIETPSTAPLAERLTALIEQRTRLFEAYGPVGVTARLQAPFQPQIRDELGRTRAFLTYQLKGLLATELNAMVPHHSNNVLTAVDVLCSFESYQLLRVEQGLSVGATSALLLSMTRVLLTSSSE